MSDAKDGKNGVALDNHATLTTLRKATMEVISEMTPHEREVLRKQFGIDMDGNTDLHVVAKQPEATRQRIKEIEEKAKEKLRNRKPDGDPNAA